MQRTIRFAFILAAVSSVRTHRRRTNASMSAAEPPAHPPPTAALIG
jgi:hypothetical protein